MKNKKIIEEMVSKKSLKELELLYVVYNEMEIRDVNYIRRQLLSWQKSIVNEKLQIFKEPDASQMIVDDVWLERFQKFFQHVPAINDLFVLEGNSVYHHASLTEEERDELHHYIDEHHKIFVRAGRNQFWI